MILSNHPEPGCILIEYPEIKSKTKQLVNSLTKKYWYATKTHGTTNMLNHIDKGPRKPLVVSDDPNQKILTFPIVEGSCMIPVRTKYNYYACRKAVSLFVVLDEQPFNAVEGKGFNCLCQTFQTQFVIPSRCTIS
jgi:hypothetical protein